MNAPTNEVRFWRNRTLLSVGVVIVALAEVGTSMLPGQATNSPRWMAVAGAIIALLFTATALAAWRDARIAARDLST